MATHLTITTEFNTGQIGSRSHEWLGWDLEVAASVMRARRHVAGGGLTYDLPVDDWRCEAGIVRVTHKWTSREQVALGGGVPLFRVKPRGRSTRESGRVLGPGSRCRRGASRR